MDSESVNLKTDAGAKNYLIEAYLETGKRAAEAHQDFQRLMWEAQSAYLRNVEEGFKGLSLIVGADTKAIESAEVVSGAIKGHEELEAMPTKEEVKEVVSDIVQENLEDLRRGAQMLAESEDLPPQDVQEWLGTEWPIETEKKKLESPDSLAVPELTAIPAAPCIHRYRLCLKAQSYSDFSQGFLHSLAGSHKVCISDSGTELAPQLVMHLRKFGINAELMHAISAKSEVVIFLGAMRRVKNFDDAMRVNEEALRLIQTLAGNFSEVGGLFILVQNTGGGFGLRGNPGGRAILGGLSSLVQETCSKWPKVQFKTIDVGYLSGDGEDKLGELIAKELVLGGPEREVSLDATRGRSFLAQELCEKVYGDPWITQASVIALVGVEAAALRMIAVQLAKEYACSLALIGSDVEEAELIDLCRGFGSDARYFAADSKDPASWALGINKIQAEFLAIHGVIFAEPMVESALSLESSLLEYRENFRNEILRPLSLLRAIANEPLRALGFVSSERFYAKIIDKLLLREHWNRRGACKVKAITMSTVDEVLTQGFVKEIADASTDDDVQVFFSAEDFVSEKPNQLNFQIGDLVDIRLRSATHSFLREFKPEPLLPVGLCLDWIMRFVKISAPDQMIAAIRDFRLHRDLQVNQWSRGGLFRLSKSENEREGIYRVLAMTITDDVGRTIATSEVLLANERPEKPLDVALFEQDELHEHSASPSELILELGPLDIAGAHATVKGTKALNWPGQWSIDVVAFEGALQLNGLWAKHALSAHCHFAGIAAIDFFHEPLFKEAAHVDLRGEVVEGDQALSRLTLRDENRTLVMAISGLKYVCSA